MGAITPAIASRAMERRVAMVPVPRAALVGPLVLPVIRAAWLESANGRQLQMLVRRLVKRSFP
jgi:hypothetical protein